MTLGSIKKTLFSNKSVFAIFLLLASIFLSLFISNRLRNIPYSNTPTSMGHVELEGMVDCSASNIFYTVLNDADAKPYQQLQIINSIMPSIDSSSKLYKKIQDVITSTTDSDVVKVKNIKDILKDLDVCAAAAKDSGSGSSSSK